ncbi:MAG: alpha/beta fold hydrolase [Desulfobacterales bacterium]|nr:alpha/beta fold hydrolase [Desulfobacterales bacterium]MDJ0854949.1 alpha/beta fold hydrolase [Desulfobacterales bacterium]MDJ0887122.1 alpha/beta fold hydrolase [Desulfobacterales bacterium]MDJ0989803.1 alpha/beta fold hydrolase [Desulfobacterales bacterium]
MIEAKAKGMAFLVGRPEARADAPTVVFVHGSGLAGEFWRRQLEDLSASLNTVAVDLPGHGRSDPPSLDSVAAYAAAVTAFIRERGFTRPIPCGLSLGGAIALQMLIDHPQTLAGGILIGTGARLRVQPEIFDLIAQDYPGFVALTARVAASPATPPARLAPVEALTAVCPPAVTAADYRACDRFDVMDRLTEINLPVLVICGADDKLTPVKYSDYLVGQIDGARRCIVPRAGHLAPVEQPAAVNAAIREFIRRTIL